jgi:hypothetical protein
MSIEYTMYTQGMSKRLQVVLEEAELDEIQRAADREELTLSEWVRKALREARARQPLRSKEAKLAVVREAVKHSFPTGDIEQMLGEIERGRNEGQPS